jgi:hypothetical protein
LILINIVVPRCMPESPTNVVLFSIEPDHFPLLNIL